MTGYDEVPYAGRALPQTQPDRLAVAAVLRGLPAPDPLACRVLEIGCGDGGNLLPLAAAAPGSAFLGVDLDAAAVDRARGRIREWGTGNADVVRADVRGFAAAPGGFDVVVAHGVYSWVPPDAREALLASVAAHLAPGGVAYVSYNVLPGSHLRAMAGQAVRRLVGDVPGPALAAAARGWLDVLRRSGADGAHARVMQEVAGEALAKPDQLLVHDDLAAVNEPLFLTDFLARAGRAGLAYAGEAEPAPAVPHWADAALAARLAAMDEVSREQALDVLTNRSFRQTLLVRAPVPEGGGGRAQEVGGAAPGRGDPAGFPAPAGSPPDPARLEPLWAAAPTAEEPSPGGGRRLRLLGTVTATSNDAALLGALEALGRAWPRALPVASLDCDRAALLRLYEAGGVELRATPVPAVRPGLRPAVRDLARLQAAAGGPVTTLRHENLGVEDPGVRAALVLFDGRRTRAQVAAALAADPSVPPVADTAAELDRLVDHLAARSLFVG